MSELVTLKGIERRWWFVRILKEGEIYRKYKWKCINIPSFLLHSAFDSNTLLTIIIAGETREEDPFKYFSIMKELDDCSPYKDSN